MDTSRYENERLALQARLDSAKTQPDRNRMGQFATPPVLASEIVAYAKSLIPGSECMRFLDPAFGTGSFYSALLRAFGTRPVAAAEGFEIDPHYARPSTELWRGTPLNLHTRDFTRAEPPSAEADKFNLVVCNPPYVRHHHIPTQEKARLKQLTERACGERIAGLAGLYCYFLGLAHAWLAENGIAVWLIPSEFMDVNYGKPVKHYLLDRVTLLRIHRFQSEDVQFEDALVSSAVVCFTKARAPVTHAAQFTFGGTLLKPRISRDVPIGALEPEDKWTHFPATVERAANNGVKLGDFFSIKRGLATGANGFFILTREQIDKHGLSMKYFRPILPSPRYVQGDEIRANTSGNPCLEPQLFLLDCRLPEREVKARHPELWAYLQAGKQALAGRYLCSHRAPWYTQEDRPPAQFLCTYMGRSDANGGRPFRFIMNHSRAVAANVYLMLYPKPPLAQALRQRPELARQVWRTLNEICPKSVASEGRVYGGGLHKLEPKELANVSAEPLARLLSREAVALSPQLELSCEQGDALVSAEPGMAR